MTDPLSQYPLSRFRDSLEWIREHEGEPVLARDLQQSVPGFKAFKGIYKPAGSRYALWIRQTRRGIYPDEPPNIHPDGSWTYRYSPESQEGRNDEHLATNRSLRECMNDHVPIGVFRQIEDSEGRTTYRVHGLGFVEGFDGSHFVIRGEPIDETLDPLAEGVVPPFQMLEFSPAPVHEVLRSERERRFTSIIRQLYREKCSLCQVGYKLRGRTLALEAAHIVPVANRGIVGDVRNGLLLCSNHHALYDNFAWTFDEDLKVVVTEDRDFRESASANHVLGWANRRLPNLPESEVNFPAREAVHWRLKEFFKHQ